MRKDFSEPSRPPTEKNSGLRNVANENLEDSFLMEKASTKAELNLLFLFQSTGWRHFWQGLEAVFQALPLFKDLFFIVRPTTTWNRVVAARHGVVFIFAFYLLPMMCVTALIEGHGLMLFGQQQVAQGMNNRFTFAKVFAYEAGSAVVTLGLIVLAAAFITSFANACHARNHFRQSLAVMFHAVGPLFLVQWFNGFPNMFFWLTWLLGVALAMSALYHGLPRLLQPDPPSAMGLYIGSALTVFLLLLGGRILTGYYLTGHLKALEVWLTNVVGKIM
jgi:hypothetical protein